MALRFECTLPPHNKFYEYEIDPDAGVLYGRYGRIGATGKVLKIHSTMPGTSRPEAIRQLKQAADLAISLRERKGYVFKPLAGFPTNWEEALYTDQILNRPPVTRVAGLPPQPQVQETTPEREATTSLIELSTVWAMNAQSVKDEEHVEELLKDPDYAVQLKVDGERAIVHIGHEGLRLFSRSPGVADPTVPKEKIIPYFDTITIPSLGASIVDCELIEKDRKPFLYVFDLLVLGGASYMKYPQQDRWKMLQRYLPDFDPEYFLFLPYYAGEAAKREFVQHVMSEAASFEGVMFKNLRSPYLQRTRPTQTWYKLKRYATWDVVIMGFHDGKEGRSGEVGSVIYGQWRSGTLTEFGRCSGMTEEIRMSMTEDPDMWIGSVIRIGGMERLPSGAIRHPRFLSQVLDKQSKDCVYRENET
jgi:predicted DNA-binding WGR domain protein